MFKIDIDVFMVKMSYQQKPYRRSLMQTYGAQRARPARRSARTRAGRSWRGTRTARGSLGIAISEAVEVAATSGGKTKYSLGSVLNHVLLHQTVIGQEALDAMEEIGEYPDVVIGCVGGGSNFAGIAFPFIERNLTQGKQTRFVAVEPASCPTLTRGAYTYDFGDTVGHDAAGQDAHAGPRLRAGRDPCGRPALSRHGAARLAARPDRPCHPAGVRAEHLLRGGILFARTEATVPAPESTHAIRAAIDEALDAKAKGEKRVILFNLSGHGHFDMAAYDAYLAGQLQDDGVQRRGAGRVVEDGAAARVRPRASSSSRRGRGARKTP